MAPPGTAPPLPFAGFLEHLKLHGFTIGIEHYLRIAEVLERSLPYVAPADLKTVLCPLIASNAVQQGTFYNIFDNYFRDVSAVPFESAAAPAVPVPRVRRRWSLAATAALVIIIAAAGVMYYQVRSDPVGVAQPISPVDPQPTPTVQGAPSTAAPPVSQDPAPAQPPRPWWMSLYERLERILFWGVWLLPLLLWAFYELWRWRRRRLALLRERDRTPPYSWKLASPAPVYVPYVSPDFQTTARRMNRRTAGDALKVDVRASIRATIRALGFPAIRYRAATRPPEYLVLIERQSARDHQACLFDQLAASLSEQGIFTSVYFFDVDPRVCFDRTSGEASYLQDLARRFTAHRLLLLGNGDSLLDPVSGRLAPWIAIFEQWTQRAVLTPENPSTWGVRERALATRFVVVPATEDGLETLIDFFEIETRPDARLWPDGERRTPEIIDASGLDELRRYLGADAFAWLCACAIYPELHWDLTLRLGAVRELGAHLLTERNLLRLMRLSWFRSGAIPDHLRWDLVRQLTHEQDHAARLAIVEQLEMSSEPPTDSHAAAMRQFEIVFHRNWAERDRPESRHAIVAALRSSPDSEVTRDHVVLRSLESLRTSPLHLVMPRRFRHLVYHHGVPVLGLRPAARGLAALAVLAIGVTTLSVADRMIEAQRLPVQVAQSTAPQQSPPPQQSPAPPLPVQDVKPGARPVPAAKARPTPKTKAAPSKPRLVQGEQQVAAIVLSVPPTGSRPVAVRGLSPGDPIFPGQRIEATGAVLLDCNPRTRKVSGIITIDSAPPRMMPTCSLPVAHPVVPAGYEYGALATPPVLTRDYANRVQALPERQRSTLHGIDRAAGENPDDVILHLSRAVHLERYGLKGDAAAAYHALAKWWPRARWIRYKAATLSSAALSELATQQITAYLAGSSKHKPATFASPSSVEKNIAAIESLLSSRVAATTGAAVNVTTLRSARNVNGRALRADLAALASAPSAGTLILYLCGAVAAGPPPGRYYFLPSDANPGDLTNTAIPLAEIASLMAGSRSRRAAIIADFPWDPAVRPPANTFLLAAARQVPAKPPRESPKGNSPFTYAVIEALSGAADNDRNGRIDVREFADFVILRTGKLTKGELRPYAVNASANIVIAHPGRQNR